MTGTVLHMLDLRQEGKGWNKPWISKNQKLCQKPFQVDLHFSGKNCINVAIPHCSRGLECEFLPFLASVIKVGKREKGSGW